MRLLVAFSSAMLTACSGPEPIIGVRERIHHDDFAYSVRDVAIQPRIGQHSADPSHTFWIVTFRVENRARRVDHRWRHDLAYVVDEQGNDYENDPVAQRALDGGQPIAFVDQHVTPAGGIEETRLVFELPTAAKTPYLKVRGGLLMGDVLDGGQFRRVRIRLF
jgi:hypothetical protein